MPDNNALANLQIEENKLKGSGFTENGVIKFKESLNSFMTTLYKKSIQYGEASKAPDLAVEITQEHVYAATSSIANSLLKRKKSPWLIVCQIFEYLTTAAAGIGGGHLDKSEGIIAFVLGIGLAVILITVRLILSKTE